ncbi:serine hydrolase domain-containing protein [Ideonella sp.]|uniref:serine hydrolase domain-containing protein n=1 Tax=Ideonella sp. TaxID=1929293 RepID=UPI0035AE533B
MPSRTALLVTAAVVVAGVSACSTFRPDRALRVATGVAAHDLCSETFVSGLDPNVVFAESLQPRPGFNLVGWSLVYHVDTARREVDATLAGTLGSRAVYREGLGCALVPIDGQLNDAPAPVHPTAAPLLPPIAGPAIVEPSDAKWRAVLDAAFAEPAQPPYERTKAVVVLRDGQVIAERYAPGYGVDTPILGFSISKSVINALLGILVRKGQLDITAPAPIAAWQGADDPRRAVTVEQLMRMTSGLDLDETGSGFDPSNQMFYGGVADMAAFAEQAKLKAAPGTRWFYSSAGVHLLARIVRDKAGGSGEAVQQFAFNELFGPLGMQHVTMETDATGTPIGAHYMLASARDWARFGSLYLNDGVAGGQRLLPEGWVKMSTAPTLETDYGAGWWPNRTLNPNGVRISKFDMPLMPQLPADAFYALGNLGQYLAVIPSERLVIVRLGRSHAKDFGARGFEALVASAVAAVHDTPPLTTKATSP